MSAWKRLPPLHDLIQVSRALQVHRLYTVREAAVEEVWTGSALKNIY